MTHCEYYDPSEEESFDEDEDEYTHYSFLLVNMAVPTTVQFTVKGFMEMETIIYDWKTKEETKRFVKKVSNKHKGSKHR